MEPKGKLMECKSCGAHFDEMLPKCPYCGTMSIKGAQAEYMEKLEDIREDVEELGEVPAEVTKKEIKKQTKMILWVLGICLGLVLVFMLIEHFFGYKEPERDDKADYLWLQENIPLLDELYEQGKYEELLSRVDEAYVNNMPIYTWEHIYFCDYIDYAMWRQEIIDEETSGQKLTNDDYELLLYLNYNILHANEVSLLSEEEKEKLQPYIEESMKDFETRWNFTKEEQAIYDELTKEREGYLSIDEFAPLVEMWMERNKK